jgi:hypothetical protein
MAIWLTKMARDLRKPTGKPYGPWRVKRVTDMIARRTYLGERDGHDALLPTTPWPDPWRQAHSPEPPPILSDNRVIVVNTGNRRRMRIKVVHGVMVSTASANRA